MADQTIVPQILKINEFKETAANTWADLTAANDGVLTVPKDGKFLLQFVDAAGGAVITITHGDGFTSSQGDLVSAAMTIIGTYVITNIIIDSARFKWLSGTDKGKIRIETSANIKARCTQLP